MSVSMECRQVNPKTAVISLAGRSSIMDGNIIQQLARRLQQDGTRYFVLDMSSLIHMDSFGLGQLIATYLSIRDGGGDVKLVGPTSTLRDLLRNTRLDTILEIFDSETEALNSIQKAHA